MGEELLGEENFLVLFLGGRRSFLGLEVAVAVRAFGVFGAEFHAHYPADAPLLHGHSVQHVRR